MTVPTSAMPSLVGLIDPEPCQVTVQYFLSMAPRTNEEALRPGQACLHCRSRKIKCDGMRPTCTPCCRGNRTTKCEYADQHIAALEESVARLEKRLQELEGQPQEMSASEHKGQESSKQSGLNNNCDELPDPVKTLLVNIVVFNSGQVGFAMNKERFLASLAFPQDHPNYPSSALLQSMYLWGLRILNCEQFVNLERKAVEKATLFVADALHSRDPKTRFQALQAEILIAQYFFCRGRALEGRYHTGAASSLAVSSGLHFIRAPILPAAGVSDLVGNANAFEFPPPRDAIEEGERINVFWVTYNVDRCWSVATGCPATLSSPTSPRSQILTPWPADYDDYARMDVENLPFNRTILDYIFRRTGPNINQPDEFSLPSLRVKAPIPSYSAPLLSSETHRPTECLKGLSPAMVEQSIWDLLNILPPLNQMDEHTFEDRSAYIVIRGLALASFVQLNFVRAGVNRAFYNVCLTSAKNIVDLVEFVATTTTIFILDPIVSVIWTTAAQALARDLSRTRLTRLPANSSECSRADAKRMYNALKEIIKRKPLMKFHHERVMELLQSDEAF
ncbi:hypothetical protein BD410DRAFT_796735 [Rickenella mellea]|uniref:Zn(2)-C6 fungal-type domain-containing protein n=1 Tax=Rickenella mellea TaxID=50990 RepID=A0A4Y7PHU9_9AGAM|nr:hypothetical protein BD410DRAFT_796735 [Rickenella mellea]